MKTLILVEDATRYFFSNASSEKLRVTDLYRKLTVLEKKLEPKARKLKLPLSTIFGSWKENIKDFDKVIVFDSCVSASLIKYIYRKTHKKCFVYYWNPLSNKNIKFIKRYRNYINVKSFDPEDCKKFNLEFAPMVYSSRFVRATVGSFEGARSVIFLGYVKDRFDKILKVHEELEKDRIPHDFYLLGEQGLATSSSQIHQLSERMNYSDYIQKVSKGGVVLDVVQSGQSGLTLRVMESLFLKKKLITTSSQVRHYDFFNQNNILVLNGENYGEITDFLATPYEDLPDDILKNYDLDYWVTNYFS